MPLTFLFTSWLIESLTLTECWLVIFFDEGHQLLVPQRYRCSLAARGRGFALWLLGARLSRITLDLSLLNISIRVRGLGEAFPFFILAVGLDSLDPMD